MNAVSPNARKGETALAEGPKPGGVTILPEGEKASPLVLSGHVLGLVPSGRER